MTTTAYIRLLCIVALILPLFTSCTMQEDITPQRERVMVSVQIGQLPLTNAITGRALNPLDAEVENRLKNLTFFQFDSEGFHNRQRDYFRIDSLNVTSYATTNINFFTGQSTIVCLANVDKDDIDDFYRNAWAQNTSVNEGEITLDQFKAWEIQIPYMDYTSNVTNAVDLAKQSNQYEGLPSAMPMSGMYSGNITAATRPSLTIMLGRMVTQLNFTVTFVNPLNKAIGYEFFNVGNRVHTFPGLLAEAINDPLHTRFHVRDYAPNYPAGASTSRFFYIAPTNAGADEQKAIRGDIYYDQNCFARFGVPDSTSMGYSTPPSPSPVRPNARVYIASVGPQDRANATAPYTLQANTIYHISLRLRIEDSPNPYDPNVPTESGNGSSRSGEASASFPVLKKPTSVLPNGTLEYSVTIHP